MMHDLQFPGEASRTGELEEDSVHPEGQSPQWAKAMYCIQCIRHVFKQNNRCSRSLSTDILALLISTDRVQSPILP
jgi:hypothetical protein